MALRDAYLSSACSNSATEVCSKHVCISQGTTVSHCADLQVGYLSVLPVDRLPFRFLPSIVWVYQPKVVLVFAIGSARRPSRGAGHRVDGFVMSSPPHNDAADGRMKSSGNMLTSTQADVAWSARLVSIHDPS